jgi:hypothetical protein
VLNQRSERVNYTTVRLSHFIRFWKNVSSSTWAHIVHITHFIYLIPLGGLLLVSKAQYLSKHASHPIVHVRPIGTYLAVVKTWDMAKLR